MRRQQPKSDSATHMPVRGGITAIHATPERRPPGKVLIRLADVRAKTGFSESTLYEEMAKGNFPKPVRLSRRAVAWNLDDVDAWIQARIDATTS